MATQNFVFDGTTDVDSVAFNWSSEWDDGWMGLISFWDGNLPGPHSAVIRLTGSDWHIETLRFAGDDGIRAIITDANTGGDRQIRNILLSDAGGQIILDRTSFETIQGWNGDTEVQTGRNWFRSILLGNGDHDLSIGTGGGRSIVAGAGDHVLSVRQGFVTNVDLGAGDHRITVTDGGRIDGLRLDGGSARVTVGEGSNIWTIRGLDADLTLTTADQYLESLFMWRGSARLTIGEGGARQLGFHDDGGERHVVRAEGRIESIQSTGSSPFDLTLGDGGAGTVALGDGGHRIKTGDGYVMLVSTGGGDDILDVGRGEIGFIRTGAGDDRITLSPFNDPAHGTHIQGGSGVDTVDLSRMGGPVTASLEQWGLWQDVAGGKGWVAFTDIEHLIGGKRADTLTGDMFDNTLTGGKGADRLTGLEGSDTFVFARTSGKDVVTDFEIGTDRLDFAGADALGDLRFKVIGDDVQIKYGKAAVLVEDVTLAEIRDAGNFLF